MSKLKPLFRTAVFFIVVFSAAQVKVAAQVIELDYNFRYGALNWTADFAGYHPAYNTNGFYELFSGVRFMPRKLTILPRRGFYIQGTSYSPGLIMFLKRRLTAADGIIAGQSYRIDYAVTLASNAPTGCGGIGGPPGESVILRAGASPIEPLAVTLPNGGLDLNIDLNTATSPAGDVANGIDCESASPAFPFALFQRSTQHPTATAGANGELWLFVGTGSGFEGMTRLYYQSIRATLTPIAPSKRVAPLFKIR
jgi:hypothetical protein